jgi:hypothetical protein
LTPYPTKVIPDMWDSSTSTTYWLSSTSWRLRQSIAWQYGCFESFQFDHVPSFSCHDVWNVRQTTSGVYAITVTTSTYQMSKLFTSFIN